MTAPLQKLIESIETPSILQSMVLSPIDIQLHTERTNETIQITNAAPFFTIEDLHRMVWIQKGKQIDYYPTYSFFAVEEEDGQFTPAMGTFMKRTNTGIVKIFLPDPRTLLSKPESNILNDFVNSDGEKKPVEYFQRGRTTLEDAFLRPMGDIPTLHIFSFKSLLKLYNGIQPISNLHWYGLFYPYFPLLNPSSTGTMTVEDIKQASYVEKYIQSKMQQVQYLNGLLEYAEYPELKTSSIQLLTFQWTEKVDSFEGVDTLFYSIPVNEIRPYMRLLTPNMTPITKLYKRDLVSLPQVSDPSVLRGWAEESIPIINSSFLISKILLRNEEGSLNPFYGTMRLAEDGTADFILQPSKNMDSIDFQRDLSNLSSTILEATQDMKIRAESVKLGRANMTVQLQFMSQPPKNIIDIVLRRVKEFHTIFQRIEPPKDEQVPLVSLRYKAISNFFGLSEDKIASFLTYMFSRKGLQQEEIHLIAQTLATEFQISEDEAIKQIEIYFENKSEHTLSDSEGKDFLVLNNPGIDISIYSAGINSFSIHFYNLRAISINDFLRACTVLSVLFYTPENIWEEVHSEMQEEDEEVMDAEDAEVDEAEEAEEEVMKTDYKEEEIIASSTDSKLFQTTSKRLNNLNLFADEDYDEDEEEEDTQLKKVEEAEEQKTEEQKIEAAEEQSKLTKPTNKLKKEKEVEEDTTKIVSYQWFIKQLQKMDPTLFKYEVDKKKGQLHYSSTCASNEDRQPLVLSKEQYLTMRNIYAKDEAENRVGFIIYGVPETEDTIKAAEGKLEQITVLRYGSDVTKLQYYLCGAYVCLKDKLPILEADWDSTLDKKGDTKPRKSCPFCHGTLIVNNKSPEEGETVMKRKLKPKSKSPQLFIRLQSGHPKGYGLPCCFLAREDIGWKDEYFTKMRESTRVTALSSAINSYEEEEAEYKEKLQESLQLRTSQIVSYELLRYRIHREYVLGSEKYPLEPGKIGIPSLALDAYFGQESSEMVSRTAIKREFKPSAQGFFRMGVLNTPPTIQTQSLFAAIAPLLGKSTIQEVQKYLKLRITPRVFLSLNFGNLLLEFFDPTDPIPPSGILNSWALTHLQNNKRGDNDYELSRFYRSYHRFLRYIDDVTQKKELRHFVHAFAEPNILIPEGLTLITLEYQGDPRDSSTEIQVKCPMLGFDMARYSRNMIGFLTVSTTGIWEPMMYISKIQRKDITPAEQEAFYILSYNDIVQPTFPEIVRKRYLEFVTNCSSSYRGAFTFQKGVDNRTLLPLTKALEVLQPFVPSGIVRDSYNHIVAVTVKGNKMRDSEILVPVVDDGNTFHYNTDLKVHLGLQTVRFALANDVLLAYKNYIEPALGVISSSYILRNFIKTTKIIGFTLGGPNAQSVITLPCADGSIDSLFEVPIEQLEPNTQFQFEYQINREILIDSIRNDTYEQSPYVLQKKQVDDIYQHLRLSFSTWIATHAQGSQLRKNVEELLERKDLPSWEKIRRLQIEFGGLIESWFAPDPNPFSVGTILLKNDCISIKDEEKCTQMCKYEEGSCKIHTPDKIQININSEPVDSVKYFSRRLFDEMIRIPVKRHEIFTKGVKRIQIPSTNIQIGTQWIIPENVPVWYDLLREKEELLEVPRYYEEYSRKKSSSINTDTDTSKQLLKNSQVYPLSDKLQSLIQPDAVNSVGIQVVGSKSESKIKALLRYLGMEATLNTSDELFESNVLGVISRKYNNIPVIQVLVQKEPINIIGKKYTIIENITGVLVLIPDYENGPAVLLYNGTGSDILPRDIVTNTVLDSITEQRVKLKRKSVIKKSLDEETSSGDESSGDETSGDETSGDETSGDETSGDETSSVETSGDEKPVLQEPVKQRRVIIKRPSPIAEEPAVESAPQETTKQKRVILRRTLPTVEEPAPQEPAPQEPVPQESVKQRRVIIKRPSSTVEEPAPQEPAPQEPAPQEPAPQEPAPQEPAPQEPTKQKRVILRRTLKSAPKPEESIVAKEEEAKNDTFLSRIQKLIT
jgi:hypothetical protein